MFQRQRNPFQEYLSPELIAKLLRETKAEVRPPEVKHFQFVVILLDDRDPKGVPTSISMVMATLVQHHANLSNISPSLFVALLGAPFPEGNSPEARRELVNAVLQDNGGRVRIAHGECDAPFGMFGGHGRWTYGALIPGFSGILKKLLEMEFGSAVEVS